MHDEIVKCHWCNKDVPSVKTVIVLGKHYICTPCVAKNVDVFYNNFVKREDTNERRPNNNA